MPNKTLVDNFIGLLQEMVLCRCLKRLFFSQILELADISTLALLSKYTRKSFPTMLPTFNIIKFRGVIYS